MSTENKKKSDCLPRIGNDDGFVLWTVYHLFDALRQVSLFQQIRNVSRLLWKKKYKQTHPDVSKEDLDNAWMTNRTFVTKLFCSFFAEYEIIMLPLPTSFKYTCVQMCVLMAQLCKRSI